MNLTIMLQIARTWRKSLFLLLGLLLLNVGLYLYLSLYQWPELVSLQQRTAQVRQAIASGKVPQDAAAIHEQGKVDLAEWHKKIPPKKDFARFLGDLLETARSNSLSLGGITYKPSVVKGENLLTYTVNFSVAGKYAQIKSFIADLAGYKEMVIIDNLSLNNSRLTEEYVDLRLDLTAYFRMEGQ